MQSFKEFLTNKEENINEMFNNPIPIRWTVTRNNNWKGEFVISSPEEQKKYIINMIKLENDMPWEIVFDLIQGKKKTQDITGTGDAVQVFSTVLNGIKQWISKVNPDAFILSAREPSRQSLYRRMLQLLPKKTWEVEDLGTSFYVQNKNMKPSYSGFSDNDFDDYYNDED